MPEPNDFTLDPDWTGLEATPLMNLSDEEFEVALEESVKRLAEEKGNDDGETA